MGLPPRPIFIYRENKWIQAETTELIPGDICALGGSNEEVCPCDMLLISGKCVVNEAMLTGESTPHSKVAKNIHLLTGQESIVHRDLDETFDISADKLHVVFGGTTIIQQLEGGSGNLSMKGIIFCSLLNRELLQEAVALHMFSKLVFTLPKQDYTK